MKGIGLIPNWQKENTPLVVEKIKQFFHRREIPLLIASRAQSDFSTDTPLSERMKDWPERIELIIVVGGDGTILRAARDLVGWQIPLLGINVGHKGFLAEIEVEQMDRYLQYIVSGSYGYRERMMLEAVVRRDHKELGRYLALNDIIVSRGPFSRIIKLDAYINNEYLESYSGDGLIVASPTGSTGYALSAGGPVVNPYLELLVITPICPHSFYNRSIIVTGSERIRLRVGSGQTQVVLTADGQVGFALEKGDSVEVFRAAQKVKLVHFADNSFYRLLHQKLKG
ncbi:MAG TPA: NAD(+)/NADH kinase [Bacillota bacterium]|nr:NAD(+)/NADH kinase [Bacillota bacterium]